MQPMLQYSSRQNQHRQPAILAVEPGVVGEMGKIQREEQRTQKSAGTVLGGDDDEIGAGLLSRYQKVNAVVPDDSVHQLVLEPCVDKKDTPQLLPAQLTAA